MNIHGSLISIEPPPSSTRASLIEFRINNGWFNLHQDILCICFNLEISWIMIILVLVILMVDLDRSAFDLHSIKFLKFLGYFWHISKFLSLIHVLTRPELAGWPFHMSSARVAWVSACVHRLTKEVSSFLGAWGHVWGPFRRFLLHCFSNLISAIVMVLYYIFIHVLMLNGKFFNTLLFEENSKCIMQGVLKQ